MDDLDYLSNLLSADIDSDCDDDKSKQPGTSKQDSVEKIEPTKKRKLVDDDSFIKDLENEISQKRKKLNDFKKSSEAVLAQVQHDLNLSEDEDDPMPLDMFSNEQSDRAHSNQYSLGLSNKTSWKSKVDTSKANDVTYSTINKNDKLDVYCEPIFGMRMINPTISSNDLKYKMTGRQPISMSKIKEHVTSSNADSIDWVIGGVIVGKSPPKTSSKGSQYCIWTLSDLKGGLKIVSLFLFGGAFTALWKTNIGTVIGVLNPSVMENSKSNEEACLSVNNGDKVMCWGTSKDYGKCKARKKDGENCTNFVNLHECEYCLYHVKQEYKKFSGRSEFQSQGGGALSSLRNKVLGKNEVFYAGQSYTAFKPAKKSAKLVARDNKLMQSLSKTGVMTSSTPLVKKICPVKSSGAAYNSRAKLMEDAERMRKLSGQPVHISAQEPPDSNKSKNHMTFKSIFQKPKTSPITTTGKKEISKTALTSKSASVTSKSVLTSRTNLSNSSSEDLFDFGDDIHLGRDKLKTDTNSPTPQPKRTSSFVEKEIDSQKKSFTGTKNVSAKDSSKVVNDKSPAIELNSSRNSIENAPKTPTLNGNIFSTESMRKSFSTNSQPPISNSRSRMVLSKDPRERKKQLARAKAESLIKNKGGIEKINPNSLKKHNSKVLNKSLELDLEIEGEKKENGFDAFKEMMNRTSRHMDLVDDVHRREEEEYFEKLEKKEQMEEKMMTTFKVECKAVRCNECKYTWFSASELCKKERHNIKVISTFKRFFKCCNCNNRTISFDVVPLRPCRHCNVNNWARAPMMKEKKVNLQSNLSIRGDETKYLSSMSSIGEASLNLLVPE